MAAPSDMTIGNLTINGEDYVKVEPAGFSRPGGAVRIDRAMGRFCDLTAQVANEATQLLEEWGWLFLEHGDAEAGVDYAQVQMLIERLAAAQEELLRSVAGAAHEHGVCRYCLCADDRACPTGCGWADETKTLCDDPRCLAQSLADGKVAA